MEFPTTLYKKIATGAILEWNIGITDCDFTVSHGLVGGAKQETTVNIYVGTNVGRANERSIEEQVVFRAEAEVEQKLASGQYFKTYQEAKYSMLTRSTEGFIRPMKACIYSEKKHKLNIPCYQQRKFNGLRCVAMKEDGEVRLGTGGGKEIHGFINLKIELNSFMYDGEILDGELYKHGMRLSEISGLVRASKNIDVKGQDSLKFVVFDYPVVYLPEYYRTLAFDTPFRQRKHYIEERCLKANTAEAYHYVVFTRSYKITSLEEGDIRHRKFLEEGYEGSIYRQIDSFYEQKRSSGILKRKEFFDKEYKIVSMTTGEGKLEGLCATIVCTNGTRTFEVTPSGTMQWKKELWVNSSKYIGQMLNVRYEEIWDDVPQRPVGTHIRPEWDMTKY